MNTFNILIFASLFVFSQFLSCQAVGDCDDVTVGECEAEPSDVIQTIPDTFTDVQDCQFYCNALTNCELFRFEVGTSGTNCTLLTKDYRKDCQVVAGPFDKKIDKCFEIDDKQTCDLFLQENCDYTGKVILEPPIGTIADPKECEELCLEFSTSIGCNYWVYSQTEKKCSLRGDNTKVCTTWAGPRNPSWDECEGTTTGAPPTTGAPTTAKPTPGPTTTKASTTAKPTPGPTTTAKPTPGPTTTKAPTTAKPTPGPTTTAKPTPGPTTTTKQQPTTL